MKMTIRRYPIYANGAIIKTTYMRFATFITITKMLLFVNYKSIVLN